MTNAFLTPVLHCHFDVTDSTNSQLICAIKDADHTIHHLYTATHQTAGRGQHGRAWVSGAGNVFLSLYVPMGGGEFALWRLSGLLSLMVGTELANLPIIHSINQYRQQQHHLPMIGVKWANDLGFYDKEIGVFKKLAGILIEPVFKKIHDQNTLVGVVIGAGLNVKNSPIIKDGLYQATCLAELSRHFNDDLKTHATALYTPITNAILSAIKNHNLCQDDDYLHRFISFFNQHHLLTNQYLQIFIQNNMSDVYAQGECIGIGSQGELLLKNADGIMPIFAGMAQIKTT